MAASQQPPGPCLAALIQACIGSSKKAEPQLGLRLAMQAMVLVLSRMATEQLLPQLPAAMREVRHVKFDLVCTTSDAWLLSPTTSCYPSFLQRVGEVLHAKHVLLCTTDAAGLLAT